MNEVTDILKKLDQGDADAAKDLIPLIYQELRRLADQQLAGEKPGQTLQPTALVHEAFLRLFGSGKASFANRKHFFGAAAEAMRRILVENSRRKGRIKHGGGRRKVEIELDNLEHGTSDEELLILHEALERLASVEPEKAKLVELRFFGGLTLKQTAECLHISLSTADRAWRYARAWLYAAMAEETAKKN